MKKYLLLIENCVVLHNVTFRSQYVVPLLYGKLCALTRRIDSTMSLSSA